MRKPNIRLCIQSHQIGDEISIRSFLCSVYGESCLKINLCEPYDLVGVLVGLHAVINI